MARKFDRQEDYVEKLEKEIRDLKSVNRQLTRRLRKIDRQFRKTLELEEEAQKAPAKKEKLIPDCPKCREGYLQPLESLPYNVCSAKCGYRIKNGR